MCLVIVCFLSLYVELPTGVAQQSVTAISLSYVTVPSYVTVTAYSQNVLTVTSYSYVRITAMTSYSFVTVTVPTYVTSYTYYSQHRQSIYAIWPAFNAAAPTIGKELVSSPTPIPEYTSVWPILLTSMIFALVAYRSKFSGLKSSRK